MGFSKQEYWSGEPFPSPGDLPNPRIKPRSLTLQADSLPSEPRGKSLSVYTHTHTHTPYLFWRNLFNIDGLAGSFFKKKRHFLNTYSQAKQFELHLVFTASH